MAKMNLSDKASASYFQFQPDGCYLSAFFPLTSVFSLLASDSSTYAKERVFPPLILSIDNSINPQKYVYKAIECPFNFITRLCPKIPSPRVHAFLTLVGSFSNRILLWWQETCYWSIHGNAYLERILLWWQGIGRWREGKALLPTQQFYPLYM
jgi:hypothetical protein